MPPAAWTPDVGKRFLRGRVAGQVVQPILGRLFPSVVDQAAYGLSTFLISALVVRLADEDDFGRFSLVWAVGWGLAAVLSELLATPARLAVARGTLSHHDAHGLSTWVRRGAVLALGVSVIGLAGPELVVASTGCLTVALSGLAFITLRALYYDDPGAGWRAARLSLMNLLATLVLLAPLLFFVSVRTELPNVAQPLASSALLLAAGVSTRGTSGRLEAARAVVLLGTLLRSGSWFATSTVIRILAFGVGLMAVVSSARGFESTATLAKVFLLATPAQLIGAALPMLLLPQLARAGAAGGAARTDEIKRQGLIYLACAGLTSAVVGITYPLWTVLVLGDSRAPSAAAVCALCSGIILTSFTGTLLLVTLAPPANLAAISVAGLASLGAAVSAVSTEALASLPYAIVMLCQIALLAHHRLRRSRGMSSAR